MAAEGDLAAYEAQCTKARSEPYKRAHLQSIHKAHQALLSNDAATSKAEGDLPHVNVVSLTAQNERIDNAKKDNTQKRLPVCSFNLCLRNMFH